TSTHRRPTRSGLGDSRVVAGVLERGAVSAPSPGRGARLALLRRSSDSGHRRRARYRRRDCQGASPPWARRAARTHPCGGGGVPWTARAGFEGLRAGAGRALAVATARRPVPEPPQSRASGSAARRPTVLRALRSPATLSAAAACLVLGLLLGMFVVGHRI